jgi:hypothetical protein
MAVTNLKLKVFTALTIAIKENGHVEMLDSTATPVAIDLMTYDSDLQNENLDDVVKYVKEYQENDKKSFNGCPDCIASVWCIRHKLCAQEEPELQG